jgi:NAD(P)-dependent dehydrogenase (short-subunit alcohol dehydrogenase family)
MGLLDGRAAIVTGGAGNLGSCICRLFAAQGARIVINDVNAEKGKALADELGTVFDPTDGSTFAGGRAGRTGRRRVRHRRRTRAAGRPDPVDPAGRCV